MGLLFFLFIDMILLYNLIERIYMDIQDILHGGKQADERKEQLKAIYSDSQERNTANIASDQGLDYVDLKKSQH